MHDKLISLIGLATKARKVVSGEELVLKEIRTSRAKLILLAIDASDNTTKKITDKCHSYQIPLYKFADRTKLGSAMGKEARVVIAITDTGFAKKMIEMLKVL